MMLGGRVAEEVTIGDYTTGASDDITKATATAREMVTQYGMSEKLGPVAYGEKDGQPFLGKELGHQANYSGQIALMIDTEIRALIDEAHDEALEILADNRAVLEELADALIEHETVEKENLQAILDKVVPRPSRKIQALMNGEPSGMDSDAVIQELRRSGVEHPTVPGASSTIHASRAHDE
jgi:cell division protease FtsH